MLGAGIVERLFSSSPTTTVSSIRITSPRKKDKERQQSDIPKRNRRANCVRGRGRGELKIAREKHA
ncbi:hypothetical protein HS088_TW04G00724 [Tripterygium wilfordii]|uniref:Uncharacterized protein n=1 Tax=Tripterygium wilfordii TaxID=458696 RepID=A0A7J7DRL7_TRIWF|nr:hypothetical protein HS088_TW04G00724 [Tripterygium wilfordii]